MRSLIIIVSLFSLLSVAQARRAFRQGSTRLSISGGTAGSFGHRYIVVGGGAGYYLLNGLEVGVDAEYYMGEKPSIFKLSPQVRYVAYRVKPVKPYVGAFYRRIFIGDGPEGEEYEDTESWGARGGVYYRASKGVFLNVGLAHERLMNCDKEVYESCTDTYPEFGIALSF